MRNESYDTGERREPAPLSARVRSGVFLSFASLVLTRLIGFGRSVVFARLLAPDDFGLFGLCVITLGALAALTNLGIDASLIVSRSSKDELSSQLNTVWTVELIRRAALTLILLAAVYPTAYFYNEKSLVTLLPFVSLVPLIEGLRNIGLVIYRKRVEFRKVVYFEQATNIASTAITILLALLARNVWALVLGQLLSSVITVILSYRFHPHRPRLEINRSALALASSYGKYGFIISVGLYITTTADNVFVGKMLGTAALGVYVLAYSIASQPVEAVGGVLNSVMFPAFAEIGAGEKERLESAFAKSLRVGVAISLLFAVPMALVSDEIVLLLFGAKWEAAGPVMRVLALVGFWRAFINNISPFLVSQRAPRPEAIAKAVESVVFLVLLYPMITQAGLAGAAWAGAAVYFLAAIARVFFVRSLNRNASGKAISIVGIALVAGAAGIACGAFMLSAVEGALMRLILGLAVSIPVTLAVYVGLQPELSKDIKTLWQSVSLRKAAGGAQRAR
jgi:O-antigen/teichoic acid export membrane protein